MSTLRPSRTVVSQSSLPLTRPDLARGKGHGQGRIDLGASGHVVLGDAPIEKETYFSVWLQSLCGLRDLHLVPFRKRLMHPTDRFGASCIRSAACNLLPIEQVI